MHISTRASFVLPRLPVPAKSSTPATHPPQDRFIPTAAPIDTSTPTVGTQHVFWGWDFSVMPPAPRQIHATLQSLGQHAEFWVDDTAWGSSVHAADLNVLVDRFDQHAPSGAVDPTRGVFSNDTACFGDMPHQIDSGSRVAILITPFAKFNGNGFDGYFNAFDQMTDAEAWSQYQQHSNERNMIYLNAAGPSIAGDYMQGVLAHEFSHLLQFGRNPNESGWLGETLAEVAMAINGYHTDYAHVADHQQHPSNAVESDSYVDYGAAYLFGTYMLERYGKAFVGGLASQSGSGREAIEAQLKQSGLTDTFGGLIADWAVANYADSRNVVAPPYHYASIDVPPAVETVVSKRGDRADGQLSPTGVAYVRATQPLTLHVDADGLAVRMLRFDGPRMTVEPVDVSKDVTVPQDGVLVLADVATSDARYNMVVR